MVVKPPDDLKESRSIEPWLPKSFRMICNVTIEMHNTQFWHAAYASHCLYFPACVCSWRRLHWIIAHWTVFHCHGL